LIEGVYKGVMVDCPIIGEIPKQRCMEHQSRPFAATNPLRVQLYRACKTCPENRSGGNHEHS
jgi:hypothetical protein